MMEEKNIHSMTYSEILDYCEKLQEKWCTDANRKYCSILQAGRCPKQFSKEKECDSLSHHFENNNWCTEVKEGKFIWNDELKLYILKRDGEIFTSQDGMNWTRRSSIKDNNWNTEHVGYGGPLITPEMIRESFSEALENGLGSYVANTHEYTHETFNNLVEMMERQFKEIREKESFFVPYITNTMIEEEPLPRLVFGVRYDIKPVPQFIDFTIDVKGLDEE